MIPMLVHPPGPIDMAIALALILVLIALLVFWMVDLSADVKALKERMTMLEGNFQLRRTRRPPS